MTTAIYTRLSLDVDGDGLGVGRQEHDCRALAERLGWDHIKVFSDNSISASSGKRRPQYEALFESISKGEIQKLIVWHPDRLHRRPIELEAFIELAEHTDLKIASVQSGHFDLSTPGGRLVARIVGATARSEMELKSARQKAKAHELARAGKPYSGHRTYGWTRRMEALVPEEAKVLREAARRVIAGDSVYSIAVDLNRREIPTTTGGLWRQQVLRKMLVHPRIAGLRVHEGEVVGEAQWPPILKRSDFETVRAILTDPRRLKSRKSNKYVLSGLIEDHRGLPMFGCRDERGFGRYRTNTPAGMKGIQIGGATVEATVIEAILKITDEITLPLFDGDTEDVSTVTDLTAELDQLAGLKGNGAITTAEWLAAREPLVRRLEAAQSAVSEVQGVPDWLRELNQPGLIRQAWPRLTEGQRRRVVEVFVKRVVIGPTDGKASFGNPASRVTVIWALRSLSEKALVPAPL